MRESQSDPNATSRLIAFPGASRSMPEWRKQLSQRVREVRERKAREAAEELAAAQEAGLVSCALPSGQLELVPDLEQPVFNPIVSKALERLERARGGDQVAGPYGAAATATALAAEYEPAASEEIIEAPPKPKLTVVQPVPSAISPLATEVEPSIESLAAPATTEAVAEVTEPAAVSAGSSRRPVRLISEDDAALSYLDTCLSLPALASDTRSDIPGLPRRFVAGLIDLLLIALMVTPALAAVYYTGGHWRDSRVIELIAGVTAATMFAYMTMSIAFTGRTLAMRLLSLRTIDLRTGLIPTGGQSIGRAIGFVFSFALLGLGQAYAIIDPDKRTVYDRLSNTIVIRV
jgi:uncharacterized RDD family membrane protein YckC